MRYSGRVRFFKEQAGYGFIIPDEGGEDVFVHRSSMKPLERLWPDQHVSYSLRESGKGRSGVCAWRVTLITTKS